MKFPLVLLLAVVVPTALAATPHGGSYRGPSSGGGAGCNSTGGSPSGGSPNAAHAGQAGNPGDVGGSTQPGSGPGATSASGGLTLGGAGSRPAAGGAVPRGIMVGEDYSKWQYWWEYNKDSYLLLKESLRSHAPVLGSDEFFMGANSRKKGHLSARASARDIDDKIVPALRKALASATNRDIVSSCLVALAKIGREKGAFALLPTFREYLVSPDQEIRETAALAMGISQRVSATPTLIELATDTQGGRRLTNRARVDVRTRAFATYGLGLIAHSTNDAGVRKRILHAMSEILLDDKLVDRNVKVAAINALGLLGSGESDDSALRAVTTSAVRTMLAFYDEDASVGRDVLRAHVPPAVARLVGRRDDPVAAGLKHRFVKELRLGTERSGLIARSAALALGQLALPVERCKTDKPFAIALRKYFASGKDGQARYFALIALAQIGGLENRNFLLGVLKRGKRALERPWAGLALGCLVHRARAEGAAPDAMVVRAVHEAFRSAKSPYARGAMAISLGLCGHEAAAPDLIDHLGSHAHQDEMSGYICVGLAMMKHDNALEPIIKVLDDSVRRPHRMRMAAIALGKLGDRRLTQRLLGMLTGKEPSLAKMAAVASALSQIGDRVSIQPLCEMLHDDKLPAISRAFAAVALGGIADKEPEPWNAKIAINMNYRAAVETLVESGAGILEIL